MTSDTNQTTVTTVDPRAFIAGLNEGPRKRDAETLIAWFEERTGLKAQMWGPSMIGFGRYSYVYDSGRAGDALLTGFSPRQREFVIYVTSGFESEGTQALLARLGQHKLGKSCLYVKRLSDLDMDVLGLIVDQNIASMKAKYTTAEM